MRLLAMRGISFLAIGSTMETEPSPELSTITRSPGANARASKSDSASSVKTSDFPRFFMGLC